MLWGDIMEQFIIVSNNLNNQTTELSIISKQEYQQEVYEYEPIAARDTFEDAKQLMLHIQKIGIQAYFNEIMNSN